jgi:5-methylcytosine-specific restriction protein A
VAYKYKRKPNRARDPRRYNAALKFHEFCPPRHDVVGPEAHQKALCRCGCGDRLEGRQKHWRNGHVDTVLRAFRIRKGDSKTIRRALFERDKGVCAICLMDTVTAGKSCFARWNAAPAVRARAEAARERFMLEGWPSPHQKGKSWWHADHIKPIVEGGENSLENLRTLCVKCHAVETAKLAGRRRKPRLPRCESTLELFALPRLTANLPQAEKFPLASSMVARTFAPQPANPTTPPPCCIS